MNHLAHLLTAGNDDDLRLGVLLGDHVRGRRALRDYPDAVARGILLHRRVDAWTDADPLTGRARRLFAPPYRRYAGIMLDVYFDHLLSRSWPRYCNASLADFNAAVLALLRDNYPHLPRDLQRFYHYAKSTGVLARYGDTGMLERVYAGLARRLSHDNPLATALPRLQQHDAELEQVFEAFWPRLLARCRRWLRRNAGY